MSSLYKFRCRCMGGKSYATATSRCQSRTTRKTATCQSCDNACKKLNEGRKLVKLSPDVRILAGLRSR